MIEVTLKELINGSETLKNLSQKPLKARTAYAVGKILKSVDVEISSFNDARMDLIRKYSEKDENGEVITDENNNVHIEPEHLKDFNKELQDLLDAPVELVVNKINVDELGDVEFTPVEISLLEKFIEFE